MDLSIRTATPDDAEAIIGILNPIIEARIYTALDTPFTIEAERDYISSLPEAGILHLAIRRADQKLVGFQSLDPFASYTHAFDHVGVMGTFVDLQLRRHGVAKRLFHATFEAARIKGYEKFFTFVRADNSAALQTYLAQGFQIIGTAQRHAKIDGRYIDEILIEKFF